MTGRLASRWLRWLGGPLLASVLLASPAVGDEAPPGSTAAGGCEPGPTRAIKVVTVPRVAGFRFRFADVVYRTGARGTARLPSLRCSDDERALAPLSMRVDQGGDTTATFDGWSGTALLTRGNDSGKISATFSQTRRVRFELRNLQGEVIPREDVGVIAIKGSTGAVVEVPSSEDSVVLEASRPVRFSGGIVSKDILWSVQSVDSSGNSVVNRGEVRFTPRQTSTVPLSLRFYRLRLEVRDAILHRPTGSAVTVTWPSGREIRVQLDDQGFATVPALARGHYSLRADGGSIAVAFDQPVAMSQPQDAELTVVSRLDLLLFFGTGLVVAVGLLLLGRRTTKRRASLTAEDPGPDSGLGARADIDPPTGGDGAGAPSDEVLVPVQVGSDGREGPA